MKNDTHTKKICLFFLVVISALISCYLTTTKTTITLRLSLDDSWSSSQTKSLSTTPSQPIVVLSDQWLLRQNQNQTTAVLQTEVIGIAQYAGHVNDGWSSFNDEISTKMEISPVWKDMVKIVHFPQRAEITVYFESNRTLRNCFHPRLLGRLSGQYLATVRWEKIPFVLDGDDTNQTKISDPTEVFVTNLTGRYQVPKGGPYYIEIIAFYCNDIITLKTDFFHQCVENPKTHRLTSQGAVLHALEPNEVITTTYQSKKWSGDKKVPPAHTPMTKRGPLGYWKWISNETAISPLQTRYQCNCLFNLRKSKERERLSKLKCSGHCLEANSTDRFENYKFEWQQHKTPHITYNGERGILNVCFVGASHARTLTIAMRDVLMILGKDHLIYVHHITVAYPYGITYDINQKNFVYSFLNATDVIYKQNRTAEQFRKDCNFTVIGMGQWSLGRQRATFPEYQEQMKTLLLIMQNMTLWQSPHNRLLIRSMHTNGMGWPIVQCPSSDSRTQPIVDRYNEIVQNLAHTLLDKDDLNSHESLRTQQRRLPSFIDTDFITQPLWDSALDFCHFDEKVSRVEAIYILYQLLLRL